MTRLRERGILVSAVARNRAGRVDLDEVLKSVAALGLTSVMVEGGATVHGAFLLERLVDHAYLFYAPIFAGDGGAPFVSGLQVQGGKEQAIKLVDVTGRRYGSDWMVHGDVVYPD